MIFGGGIIAAEACRAPLPDCRNVEGKTKSVRVAEAAAERDKHPVKQGVITRYATSVARLKR